MDRKRLDKIGRLIQKELSIIFQQNMNTLFSGNLITPTKVNVSADLSIAKIYVSIFAVGSQKIEDIFALINKNNGLLRLKLGENIRHQIRIIPQLSFFIDDSLDYQQKIEQLLKQ